MNNHVTNGDGFGVGWYHHTTTGCDEDEIDEVKKQGSTNGSDKAITKKKKHEPTVAIFKDTQPAWNNMNLRELCQAVQSDCIVAHVRAASVFAGISQQNCHPFKAGPRLLFCHNGRIGNFDLVRRQFHNLLSDEAYKHLQGTTDSETLFALLCTYLSNDEKSSVTPYQQTEPFGYERLTTAVKKVLKTIEHILEQAGLQDNNYCTLNFCITDGETVVVTRFCDKSPNVPPPSLYFAFGDATKLHYELTTELQDHSTPITQSHNVATSSTLHHQSSSVPGDDPTLSSSSSTPGPNGSGDDTVSVGSSDYDERPVNVDTYESKPGTIYTDINPSKASLIVASNPLTKTHTWHPMPKNSLLWYQRGSLPELRLLRHSKKRSHSFVLSSTTEPSILQLHSNQY
jgi:predicted glutamine amidotransferase